MPNLNNARTAALGLPPEIPQYLMDALNEVMEKTSTTPKLCLKVVVTQSPIRGWCLLVQTALSPEMLTGA